MLETSFPLFFFFKFQLCPMLCDSMDCSLQAPLSMGFSRQEYWSGLPYPPPGYFPTQGSNSSLFCLLHWQTGSLSLVAPGKPLFKYSWYTTSVNFCCIAKWLSYTYTYTFSYSFPLWFVTGYWIWFPVLYSKTLFIHPVYNSLYLLIP